MNIHKQIPTFFPVIIRKQTHEAQREGREWCDPVDTGREVGLG